MAVEDKNSKFGDNNDNCNCNNAIRVYDLVSKPETAKTEKLVLMEKIQVLQERLSNLITEMEALGKEKRALELIASSTQAEVQELKRDVKEKVHYNLMRIKKEKEDFKNGISKEIEEVKLAKSIIESKVVEMEKKLKAIGEDAEEIIKSLELDDNSFNSMATWAATFFVGCLSLFYIHYGKRK